MEKKYGFTLIELLAVIVILAIIAVISVPLITGVIDKARLSAYKESLRGIFSATDLYIASSGFNGFPDEGIDVTNSNIQMKNKNFTSGKIFKNAEGKLELDKVSDGKYCGSGPIDNIVIIEGSCDSLDVTAPTVTITSNLITSNSITILADAEDLESGINNYQFSKDNGTTWTTGQASSNYTFTGLSSNTNYTFRVRVYNNNSLSTISDELNVTTVSISAPVYSISTTNWTQSAVVTINYQGRETGYIYDYSLDDGITWIEVESPDITKDITFTANGNVIARISDGTNIISGGSYNVTNVDTTPPVITVNPTNVIVGINLTYTDQGVTAADDMLGDITTSIIKTGNVNTSTIGTYILTYNVSDLAGNTATAAQRTVNVIQTVNDFTYTGNSQTFTVPYTGTYRFEVWGAEGGNGEGGKGGYASGEKTLSQGAQIYVYVGGAGGFNGGRSGAYYSKMNSGGATDIRVGGTSLANRVIVAGGGGGKGGIGYGEGGPGGGLNGVNGYPSGSRGGYGGTQSAGGGGGAPALDGTSGSGAWGSAGTLGTGGAGGTSHHPSTYGGHGGGGYYGGGGGGGAMNNSSGSGSGGGGSSYIGGVSSGQTIAGNASMPNPSGGTETGHIGNGYAKITFISQ